MNEEQSQKGEFLDAIRRHICQILGFDYGFIDVAVGHEINNVASFCFDDEDDVASEFVESLVDEHKQPITVANTLVAQTVKQNQRPWIGKAYSQDDVEKGLEEEEGEGFPYIIVPVLSAPGSGASEVMGLIRVIAFDASREVTSQDLTTLKLMGEHLASRTGLFGDLSMSSPTEKPAGDTADLDHVLILHSNRLVRRRFNRILGAHYRVAESESSERALEHLDNNRVDVILLDSELQGTSGFGFCKVLKETSRWKHIPVILVIADNSTTARVEGLNVGADDCLPDSCFDSELIARVRSSLRHRKAERELSVQLQLLEDYAQRLEKAHEQLSIDRQSQIQKNSLLEQLRRDSEVQRHQDNLLHRISNIIRKSFLVRENLEEMLEALSGWFSLDCTFIVMPNEEEPEDTIRVECVSDKNYKVVAYDRDLDIFEIFKKHFQPEQALICNDVSTDRRLDPFHKILKSGFSVQSLFYIPISYEQKLQGLLVGYKCETRANWSRINETFMKAVVDQVATGVVNARLYARVQRQATTDGLTGLFNHRTGQEKLADQLKQAERYERRLSVIMLDVDHFKSINDTYGHPAGDSVLKAVARIIMSSSRDVDIPVRYGGEEFLLVLPEITMDGATVVAERIRNALKAETIVHEDLSIKITGSFGVACFPDDASNQQGLLDLADKALYLSKRLGRDQVHTASDLMFEPEEPPPQEKSSEDVANEMKSLSDSGKFTPPTISEEARQHETFVPEVVDMVKSLAASLYAKSDYNKEHHLEVARMSELMAKVMGLSAQQVEQIRVAGLLHDVGLLQLPDEVLSKEGNLTEEERDIVNQHATLGAQMLRPVRALKDICEILENHHERWDGTGYPKGLKGEEIPLPARIVAIVDSYHAMISERPYRPAMTYEEAQNILKEGSGKQWDPFLIEIFNAVMKSMRETTKQVQAKVALVSTMAKPQEVSEAVSAEKDKVSDSVGHGHGHAHDHHHAHEHDHGHSQAQPHAAPESKDEKTEDRTRQPEQIAPEKTSEHSEGHDDIVPSDISADQRSEPSKISSIIGPVIRPIAPPINTPEPKAVAETKEEATTAAEPPPAAQPVSVGELGIGALALPAKQGFAVPGPASDPVGRVLSPLGLSSMPQPAAAKETTPEPAAQPPASITAAPVNTPPPAKPAAPAPIGQLGLPVAPQSPPMQQPASGFPTAGQILPPQEVPAVVPTAPQMTGVTQQQGPGTTAPQAAQTAPNAAAPGAPPPGTFQPPAPQSMGSQMPPPTNPMDSGRMPAQAPMPAPAAAPQGPGFSISDLGLRTQPPPGPRPFEIETSDEIPSLGSQAMAMGNPNNAAPQMPPARPPLPAPAAGNPAGMPGPNLGQGPAIAPANPAPMPNIPAQGPSIGLAPHGQAPAGMPPSQLTQPGQSPFRSAQIPPPVPPGPQTAPQAPVAQAPLPGPGPAEYPAQPTQPSQRADIGLAPVEAQPAGQPPPVQPPPPPRASYTQLPQQLPPGVATPPRQGYSSQLPPHMSSPTPDSSTSGGYPRPYSAGQPVSADMSTPPAAATMPGPQVAAPIAAPIAAPLPSAPYPMPGPQGPAPLPPPSVQSIAPPTDATNSGAPFPVTDSGPHSAQPQPKPTDSWDTFSYDDEDEIAGDL